MPENKPLFEKKVLIIAIVLFVFIVVLGLAVFFMPDNVPPVAVAPTSTPTPTAEVAVTPTPETTVVPTITPAPISTIDVSDWVIYQNRSEKYRLRIPFDWIKEDDGASSKEYFTYSYGEFGGYQILQQPEANFILHDKAFGKKPTECDKDVVEHKDYNNDWYTFKICKYNFFDAADIEFDMYTVYTEVGPYMEMTYKIKSDLGTSAKEKYENIFYQILNNLIVN